MKTLLQLKHSQTTNITKNPIQEITNDKEQTTII